jgi:hypothetical protein
VLVASSQTVSEFSRDRRSFRVLADVGHAPHPRESAQQVLLRRNEARYPAHSWPILPAQSRSMFVGRFHGFDLGGVGARERDEGEDGGDDRNRCQGPGQDPPDSGEWPSTADPRCHAGSGQRGGSASSSVVTDIFSLRIAEMATYQLPARSLAAKTRAPVAKNNRVWSCPPRDRSSTFPGTSQGKLGGGPGQQVRGGESHPEAVSGLPAPPGNRGHRDGRKIGRGSFGIVERSSGRRV